MLLSEQNRADRAHVAAAEYATERRQQTIRFRSAHNLKPFDFYASEEIWLAHYEGFRAGLAARDARDSKAA